MEFGSLVEESQPGMVGGPQKRLDRSYSSGGVDPNDGAEVAVMCCELNEK